MDDVEVPATRRAVASRWVRRLSRSLIVAVRPAANQADAVRRPERLRFIYPRGTVYLGLPAVHEPLAVLGCLSNLDCRNNHDGCNRNRATGRTDQLGEGPERQRRI